MARKFTYDIMPLIKERWSPRAFSRGQISKETVMAVIEAASFAPSCFNEQPWRFIIADNPEKLSKMHRILVKQNLEWAGKAPVLFLVLSYKYFDSDKSKNRWNMFDTGTAWGYMSLEAQKRGCITHAMGGFSQKKAREEFDISDEYDIMAVVALGKMGDKSELSSERQKDEYPNERKNINELIIDTD